LKTFAEINLIPALHRALAEENYETPTPIQAQTIPVALEGRDVLGCAQTGTGKTAAFALPILNRLGSKSRKAIPNHPRVLVLAPTRELAIQIGDSFETYGRHLGLRVAMVFGGVGQGKQVNSLERGAHILVATPGRLLDLMNQGYIELDRLDVFVLDEADRMLDMGFLPDLRRIIKHLPDRRQSLFFSATMPPKIIELAQQLLTRPVSVNVTPKETSVERIAQKVLFVERTQKLALLSQILQAADVDRAIVFTKTKHGANGLAEKLGRRGIVAAAIHGNKSQGARQRALEAFRVREVHVLVATDVAARGIDIDGVSHVINYDLPSEPESYVHRIGRTGRAGADGIALTFCGAAERSDLRAIEKLIGRKIPPGTFELEPDTHVDEPPVKRRNDARPQSSTENRPPKKKRTSGNRSTGKRSSNESPAAESTTGRGINGPRRKSGQKSQFPNPSRSKRRRPKS
jgi:ATP-dependent RNA helicase RhlE